MWDTTRVASESDGLLSREEVLEVIKQYQSLNELYPDVREVNDG